MVLEAELIVTPSAQRVIARSVGGQASIHVTSFLLPRLIVYQRLHALSYSSRSLNVVKTTAFVSDVKFGFLL